MGKILSYSNNTVGSDWIRKEPYSGDDISMIQDPNGGLVESPRTAIPSPFAIVDLVATAFGETASDKRLETSAMNKALVSNSLDVMQLMFEYQNHADKLRIVVWNPRRQIEKMLNDGYEHRLLAQTLKLYLESDHKAYNFDIDDEWYIIMHNNKPLGSTSPATGAMAAPDAVPTSDIMLEEGVMLFDERRRQLWQRDGDFVVWLVHLFNAYKQWRVKLHSVYDYILVNLDIIRSEKPELYERIVAKVPNPHAMTDLTFGDATTLTEDYDEFDIEPKPRIAGCPVLCRRRQDMFEYIADSDFLISPTFEQSPDEQLPLVLRNGFKAAGIEQFKYINKPWSDTTEVDTLGLPINERCLPDTSISYPWITTTDLLEDSIIELATPIDSAHYFDAALSVGQNVASTNGFLLPIKPLFFKYFNASLLSSNVVPGKRCFELRAAADGSVTATLRIPVKKSYVELTRTYRRTSIVPANAKSDGDGIVVSETRISVSLFPFVRTGINDMYNVQLFEMIPDFKASLRFYADKTGCITDNRGANHRTPRTAYHTIDTAFDYMRVEIISTDSRHSHSGVILPLWQPYKPSTDEFLFAVDFGTTNSHVEYAINDMPPMPLLFDNESGATLVASLALQGSLAQNDAYLDIEFLPRTLNELYGFPLRTAMSENIGNSTSAETLMNINIPFLYERKVFNGYKVNTSLKWADNTMLAEQFLREIMLMIRAKVLISKGDLHRTRIIYFYPVSMKKSLQHKFLTTWENLYQKYIADDKVRIISLPESIAPTFYYNNSNCDGANFVSVDIGGGTSDIVVYKGDAENFSSNLNIITSFRFAGNAIFGDGFLKFDADNNPLLKRYAKYFSRLVSENRNLNYLDVILSSVMESKRSDDVNAFLFSIENSEFLRTMSAIDRRKYSYNAVLGDDDDLKILFVYFYSAIIYYIANLMKSEKLDMPKYIYFSGTGSKILDIVGRKESIDMLSREIIEKVYERHYKESTFEVKMELDIPKQITCKGGLELIRSMSGEAIEQAGNVMNMQRVMDCKHSFTLTDDKAYTYSEIRNRDVRLKIENKVSEFNKFFVDLLDKNIREEFGIARHAIDLFARESQFDIPNYLAAGIKAFLPIEEGGDEMVEDVPFFYPLIGIIRNRLLDKLIVNKDDELNN